MAIDGKWDLTIQTPVGERMSTLDVSSSGGKLIGKQTGDQGTQDIENGAIDGDEARWSIDIVVPMPMTLTFTGTVSGDTMAGTVQLGAFGESTFSGARA